MPLSCAIRITNRSDFFLRKSRPDRGPFGAHKDAFGFAAGGFPDWIHGVATPGGDRHAVSARILPLNRSKSRFSAKITLPEGELP
jgi:hypothetical protein